jgi:hypothetical protein
MSQRLIPSHHLWSRVIPHEPDVRSSLGSILIDDDPESEALVVRHVPLCTRFKKRGCLCSASLLKAELDERRTNPAPLMYRVDSDLIEEPERLIGHPHINPVPELRKSATAVISKLRNLCPGQSRYRLPERLALLRREPHGCAEPVACLVKRAECKGWLVEGIELPGKPAWIVLITASKRPANHRLIAKSARYERVKCRKAIRGCPLNGDHCRPWSIVIAALDSSLEAPGRGGLGGPDGGGGALPGSVTMPRS